MELLGGLAVTALAAVLAVWINDKFAVGGAFPDEVVGEAGNHGGH